MPQMAMPNVGGQASASQGMLQRCQQRQENRRVGTDRGTAREYTAEACNTVVKSSDSHEMNQQAQQVGAASRCLQYMAQMQ